VLLDDEEAEHIPGCNMAFRREALEEIGGFDPIYRAAGDDVDVCWRLQERGHRIGFSPAAMVWHFRRNSVTAYIGQQKGYGKAEALLYFRHPQRFNALGYSRWRGRIYGGVSALLSFRRPIVYGGVFGRGLFQTLYQPPSSFLSHLPLTFEWNALGSILLLWALARGGWATLGALPLLLTWTLCVAAAWRARVDARAEGFHGRLLIAVLTYVGPLLRCLERYRWWARGLSVAEPAPADRTASAVPVSWRARAFSVAFWNENGQEKEIILHGLRDAMVARRTFVRLDQGWSDWDLEVHGGLWSRGRVTVCTENHGGNRRVLRVRCVLRSSLFTRLGGLAGLAVAVVGASVDSVVLTGAGLAAAAVVGTAWVRGVLGLGQMLYTTLQTVARRARLHYAPPVAPRERTPA
jgi:hypothetical protein